MKTGDTVRTRPTLPGRDLFLSNTAARRPDTRGTLGLMVPGYGGDVWWVRHDDAAPDAPQVPYVVDEFDVVQP